MDRISKGFALFFVLIIVFSGLSLLMVKPVSAQTIPKPSVPQFTVKQVVNSYDVPIIVTTTTDPFTGNQVTTSSHPYHQTKVTIDITIRNQQFSPFDFGNGTIIQLYFSVRAKAHFGDWNNTSSSNGYYFKQLLASSSDTVLTLTPGDENGILMGYVDIHIPLGGQEDFQVSAQAGYLVPDYGGHILPYPLSYDFISFGESGWSNTQTITLTETSSVTSINATTTTSSTPTPTQTQTSTPAVTPSIPEFAVATIPVMLGLISAAGLLAYFKKHGLVNKP